MGILDDAPPERGAENTTVQQASISSDTPPKKRRGRPPGSKNTSTKPTTKAETEKISKALSMILSVPAIPAQMVGDEWLMGHFNTAGPQLAQILAEASERNPALRAWLLRAMAGESVAILAIGVVGYIVPPVVYFATPENSPMRAAFAVPPIAPMKRQKGGEPNESARET